MSIRQFLGWFPTASTSARTDAACALARAYLYSDMEFEDREAAEAAMTLLLDDHAPSVRKAMAEVLAASSHAPRHIILALAGDQAEVAEAVLERSPVLLDAELVDFVAMGTVRSQSAIARRIDLSPSVAAAIAEIADMEACIELLGNVAVIITMQSLRRIAERLGRHAVIRDALFKRHDLPLDVHQLLISELGNALLNLPVVQGSLKPQHGKNVVREACDKATIQLICEASDHELPLLIDHLRERSQLTPILLLRSICAGDIRMLVAVLSQLTNVSRRKVIAILSEGRSTSLAALYERAGLPAHSYPAFDAAIRVWRDMADYEGQVSPYDFSRQMIERVLERYEGGIGEDHDQLMVFLRRFAAEAARDAARHYMQPFMQAA